MVAQTTHAANTAQAQVQQATAQALSTAQAMQTATAQAVQAVTAQAIQIATARAVQATTTAQAQATGTAESRTMWGPFEGELKHDRKDGTWLRNADVNLRDFIAEATFYNPYGYPNQENKRFDYGFMFRRTRSDDRYQLFVGSGGAWKLELFKAGRGTNVYQAGDGSINNLDPSEGGSNKLRLEVNGGTARLSVNDVDVSVLVNGRPTTLDVSGHMESGDVVVGTGFLPSNTIQGMFTRFTDFIVRSRDP